MLEKLGIKNYIQSMINLIERNTGKRCFDIVPKNQKPPFYKIQFLTKTPENNKTQWRERFSVWVWIVSSQKESKAELYDMIEALEEAYTEEITLPLNVALISQVDRGIQSIEEAESGEFVAISELETLLVYGYKTKV